MTGTPSYHDPDKKELRQFGLVFASGIALIFGLFLPWLFEHPWPLWPWIVAGVFTVTALLLPQALRPVFWLWMKFGHVLGWINTRIILGITFLLLFITGGPGVSPVWQGPDAAPSGSVGEQLSNQKRAPASRTHGETVLMLDLLKDLWDFLKIRKKFWLAPIILVLLLLGALIVLSQGSAVAPFIYTLF